MSRYVPFLLWRMLRWARVSGDVDVARVEGGGLTDAGAGVEGGKGDRLVPQRRAAGFAK
jgi:hypothetical protein